MESNEDEAAKFVDGLLEFSTGDGFAENEEMTVLREFKIDLELPAANEKCALFVDPPAVVLYYSFDSQSDSDKLRGMNGSDLETYFEAFEPSGAYVCCNVDGFSAVAILWFSEGLSGMENALRVERSFIDRDCGRRDFEKAFDLDVAWKEEFYGWVATTEDYECYGHFRSKTIQNHLKEIGDVKDLTEMYAEEKRRIAKGEEKAGIVLDLEEVVGNSKKRVEAEVKKRVDSAKREQKEIYDRELAEVYDSLTLMKRREQSAELRVKELNSSVARAMEKKGIICREVDGLSISLWNATVDKIELTNKIEDLKHCTFTKGEENMELEHQWGAITSSQSDSEREYFVNDVSEELNINVQNALGDFEDVLKRSDVETEIWTGEIDVQSVIEENVQVDDNLVSFVSGVQTNGSNSMHQRSFMDGVKHQNEEKRTEAKSLRIASEKLKKYDAGCEDFAIAQKRNRSLEETVEKDMLLNEAGKKFRREKCGNPESSVCWS